MPGKLFNLSSRWIVMLGAAIMFSLLSACNGTPINLTPTAPPQPTTAPQPNVPFSTSVPPPTRTPYPSIGPKLSVVPKTFVNFASGAPAQIGRFTLNKDKSFGSKDGRGGALIYEVPNMGEMTVAFWVNDNTNDSFDRFNIETGMITGDKFPVALGDAAIVAPGNKASKTVLPGKTQDGVNPVVWGEVWYGNTVTILYPSNEMRAKMTDFSKDEAIDLLTKMYNAIPKQ